MMKRKSDNSGFTLIELLVVIAIIGILSSVVLASLNSARAKARDASRAASMKQVSLALETYFQDTGAYPITPSWRGYQTSCGTAGGDVSGPNAYIPGLTPNYISTLPIDPGSYGIGGCNGYLYYSADGRSYAFLNHLTPESFPPAGNSLHDPIRPTWSWKVCSGPPGCSY